MAVRFWGDIRRKVFADAVRWQPVQHSRSVVRREAAKVVVAPVSEEP